MPYGNFEFRGTGLSFLWLWIWTSILNILTLFILFPWTATAVQKWIAENTFIDNKQLTFMGTGLGFFGNWLFILIFSIITLGLYIPWGFCRMRRWLVENLYFAEDADIEKGVPCRASTRKSEKDKVIPAKKAVDAFYCTQCGTKNESSSKFCIECGSKI